MDGWIKLHRKLLEWEWFMDGNMLKLFLYLLLSANHRDSKWQGVDIKRGQLITGQNSLSKKTKISVQSLRTCINRLKSTGEITVQSTNKYSIITICNFDEYQMMLSETNNQKSEQLTIEQQSTNNQLTTDKKDKKNKKVKKTLIITERKKNFELKTKTLNAKVGLVAVNVEKFNLHWTQAGEKANKMKFEKETTFDHKARMQTWKLNDYGGHQQNNKQAQKPTGAKTDYSQSTEDALAEYRASLEGNA